MQMCKVSPRGLASSDRRERERERTQAHLGRRKDVGRGRKAIKVDLEPERDIKLIKIIWV